MLPLSIQAAIDLSAAEHAGALREAFAKLRLKLLPPEEKEWQLQDLLRNAAHDQQRQAWLAAQLQAAVLPPDNPLMASNCHGSALYGYGSLWDALTNSRVF